jgi:type IV pilus assembly protein PilW
MKVIVANSRMRGFSLVELMVAITISSLLLVGVIALFVSSRASYETTEKLSRIQENGRFALDQLATDLRAAGFQSCARGTTPKRMEEYAISTIVPGENPDPLTTDLRWNFKYAAQGYEATDETWAPELNTGLFRPAPEPTGDVLVLRIPRREARALELRESQADGVEPLQIYNVDPMPLETGDLATIADCGGRAFFQVTGYDAGTGELFHAQVDPANGSTLHTPGNYKATVEHRFEKGATILPVVTMVYYLAPTPAEDDDPTRMSLWRKSGGAVQSDEIAQDIDRLEVRYGVDDGFNGAVRGDGRVDQYVTADEIGSSWERVMTVQVALLARAPQEYGNDRDNTTYVLFSDPELTAGPFNDRTQRKVFTATLALRNQITD